MTDEEMAEKYVIDTGNNDCTIEAFLAGLKAGRPEWHDLRKNPNDLPKESGKYIVAIPNEDGFIETDTAIFTVSFGWEYFDIFVDDYGREHIIAWKEYPTFYEKPIILPKKSIKISSKLGKNLLKLLKLFKFGWKI